MWRTTHGSRRSCKTRFDSWTGYFIGERPAAGGRSQAIKSQGFGVPNRFSAPKALLKLRGQRRMRHFQREGLPHGFRTWGLNGQFQCRLAQLVRAPDQESGCRGFNSRTEHHNCRLVTDRENLAKVFRCKKPEGGGRPFGRPSSRLVTGAVVTPGGARSWISSRRRRALQRGTARRWQHANRRSEVRGYRLHQPLTRDRSIQVPGVRTTPPAP